MKCGGQAGMKETLPSRCSIAYTEVIGRERLIYTTLSCCHIPTFSPSSPGKYMITVSRVGMEVARVCIIRSQPQFMFAVYITLPYLLGYKSYSQILHV